MTEPTLPEATLADAKASFSKIADQITDRCLEAMSAEMLRLGFHRGLEERTERLRPLVAIAVAAYLVEMLSEKQSQHTRDRGRWGAWPLPSNGSLSTL